MKSAFSIKLESEPQATDMGVIVKGLSDFNSEKTGGAAPQYLLVTVRSEEGTVVGGLLGATYLGWLQVHSVWLPEALRGRNLGSELMAIAEDEAVRRRCLHVFLETLSFQALPFYEKLG